ncbi:SsgA family sporulation/cell division regulator [Streptomyces sp. NPDC016459]|uniref:SsgA family sporulation/cell division regulator n=1 Tax=Streptomyces sp. NPDC016459 TaxID=3157190 RepID=UPI00340FEC1F
MTMELLTADRPVEIEATLTYTSRAPHTMCLALHLLEAEPVIWHLDREMVLAGSYAPVGVGELHLWPAVGDGLLIRLGSPGQCATLRGDRDQLAAFVRRTFLVVPPGTEARHIDWQPLFDTLSS